MRDFLEVLRRRWRGAHVIIVPTRVQGDGASREIAAAIEAANRLPLEIDCLVVGRGGGSLEDLWAFNEEPVIRAIHASRIPVISAVGHEIDVTLADLVADVRALTPSEAAERVAPSSDELTAALAVCHRRLTGAAGPWRPAPGREWKRSKAAARSAARLTAFTTLRSGSMSCRHAVRVSCAGTYAMLASEPFTWRRSSNRSARWASWPAVTA